jgi:hypothetical protein
LIELLKFKRRKVVVVSTPQVCVLVCVQLSSYVCLRLSAYMSSHEAKFAICYSLYMELSNFLSQNIRENGREECMKSLLKFSPRLCKANPSDADAAALLGRFDPKLLVKDFCTFRQFYTQYRGKDLSEVCVCVCVCVCA